MSEKIQDSFGRLARRCGCKKIQLGKVRKIVTPNYAEHKKNIMKQKTEIEIEFSETVAYSSRRERFEAYCSECNSLVEMTTPQVAGILTHSNEREIYRLVETGKVHFVETDRVLICLKSLTETLS